MKITEQHITKRSHDVNMMAIDKLKELIDAYLERPDEDDEGFAPFFLDCAAAIYVHAIGHVVLAGEDEGNARNHLRTLARTIESVIEQSTSIRNMETKVGH